MLFSILSVFTVLVALIFLVGAPMVVRGYETIFNVYTNTDTTSVSPKPSEGENQYFEASYSDEDRAKEEAKVGEQVEAEGAVLLRNENEALPLPSGSKDQPLQQVICRLAVWWHRIKLL